MSLKIANALFDIFVKELRARESTREDFCAQYEMGLKEIPVYLMDRYHSFHERARYFRRPNHLGEIIVLHDLQGTLWVNEAIVALENQLARLSPLERMDWFNEEETHV